MGKYFVLLSELLPARSSTRDGGGRQVLLSRIVGKAYLVKQRPIRILERFLCVIGLIHLVEIVGERVKVEE